MFYSIFIAFHYIINIQPPPPILRLFNTRPAVHVTQKGRNFIIATDGITFPVILLYYCKGLTRFVHIKEFCFKFRKSAFLIYTRN